jgi:hypothetical protein
VIQLHYKLPHSLHCPIHMAFTYAPQIVNQTAPNPAPPQMHTLPISMQTTPNIAANHKHTVLIAANTAPHDFLTRAVSPPVTKYTPRIMPTPTHSLTPRPQVLLLPLLYKPFAKTLMQDASTSAKDARQTRIKPRNQPSRHEVNRNDMLRHVRIARPLHLQLKRNRKS